jgi:hypothetical protein
MPNFRIITPNESDDAVLTASPALITTLPVENLQDATRAKVARSNAVVLAQHILGNFNEAKNVSAMALVRHNLTADATLRFKVYDDLNQTGNLTYDSGTVALSVPIAWGDFIWGPAAWGGEAFADWPVVFSVMWFDPVAALSFDLEINDGANADGYLEASRLFVGLYWTPEVNINYGVSLSWVDKSTQERTDGGSLRTDAVESFRRWEMDLSRLTSGERAQLSEILRRTGLRNDLFLSVFPEESGETERDYSGAVKLVQNVALIHDMFSNFRTQTLAFEES